MLFLVFNICSFGISNYPLYTLRRSFARYKLVSITDDKGLVPRIEERRNLSKLPPVVTKLIHNRYTYNTFYFSKNYITHFTPDFLFLNGAGHRQHHVQGIGNCT